MKSDPCHQVSPVLSPVSCASSDTSDTTSIEVSLSPVTAVIGGRLSVARPLAHKGDLGYPALQARLHAATEAARGDRDIPPYRGHRYVLHGPETRRLGGLELRTSHFRGNSHDASRTGSNAEAPA